MSIMLHGEGFSIVSGGFKADLSLDRLGSNLQRAQQWLGDRVLEDCKAVMPLLTGSLQQRSYVEDDGKKVVFPGPYARFQYGGRVMVDPVTGSPWARAGVKKVLTDRPLTYSNPQATSHWFDTAKARFGEYWTEGTAEILGGK